MESMFNSPFIIPVAGIFLGLVLGLGNIISQIKARELRAQQRLAMISRGMSSVEIETALGPIHTDSRSVRDPLRSLASARRAALILSSSGLGFAAFGLVLAWLVRQREAYVVPAVGLIPIAIGIGFFVDYNMQKRELSRFGMDLDVDSRIEPRT